MLTLIFYVVFMCSSSLVLVVSLYLGSDVIQNYHFYTHYLSYFHNYSKSLNPLCVV